MMLLYFLSFFLAANFATVESEKMLTSLPPPHFNFLQQRTMLEHILPNNLGIENVIMAQKMPRSVVGRFLDAVLPETHSKGILAFKFYDVGKKGDCHKKSYKGEVGIALDTCWAVKSKIDTIKSIQVVADNWGGVNGSDYVQTIFKLFSDKKCTDPHPISFPDDTKIYPVTCIISPISMHGFHKVNQMEVSYRKKSTIRLKDFKVDNVVVLGETSKKKNCKGDKLAHYNAYSTNCFEYAWSDDEDGTSDSVYVQSYCDYDGGRSMLGYFSDKKCNFPLQIPHTSFMPIGCAKGDFDDDLGNDYWAPWSGTGPYLDETELKFTASYCKQPAVSTSTPTIESTTTPTHQPTPIPASPTATPTAIATTAEPTVSPSLVTTSEPTQLTVCSDCSQCSGAAHILVTENIGVNAFFACTSLISVTIADGVTGISYGAFEFCTSLVSVAIPGSVSSIGYYSFDGCTSLMSVTIADGVTGILEGAFQGCISLVSVTLPSSVNSIDSYAFKDCTSLAYVTNDGTLSNIGDRAFYYCTSLISITIADGLTNIGYGAFERCNSLISIVIPDSVSSIGDYSFAYCTSLSCLSWSVPYSEENAQKYCTGCEALPSVVYNVPVVVPPDLASTFSINCKKDLTGIDSIRSEWGKKDMCIAALSEDVTGRLNKKKKR